MVADRRNILPLQGFVNVGILVTAQHLTIIFENLANWIFNVTFS